MVAAGQTAKEALVALVEACNDEDISIENNWLRLKIKGEDYFYG